MRRGHRVRRLNIGPGDFPEPSSMEQLDIKGWYQRGERAWQSSKWDEAADAYDNVIRIRPKDDRAWYNKGLALRQLGELDEAIICYNKALEIKPENDKAWVNSGFALYTLGRFDNAILMSHRGYATVEVMGERYEQALHNILNYLDGKPLNLINPDVQVRRAT